MGLRSPHTCAEGDVLLFQLFSWSWTLFCWLCFDEIDFCFMFSLRLFLQVLFCSLGFWWQLFSSARSLVSTCQLPATCVVHAYLVVLSHYLFLVPWFRSFFVGSVFLPLSLSVMFPQVLSNLLLCRVYSQFWFVTLNFVFPPFVKTIFLMIPNIPTLGSSTLHHENFYVLLSSIKTFG